MAVGKNEPSWPSACFTALVPCSNSCIRTLSVARDTSALENDKVANWLTCFNIVCVCASLQIVESG